MQPIALIANTLWSVSNLPAYGRFRGALANVQTAQCKKLMTYLGRNADTAFGQAFKFGQICSYEEFARRVPLADYDAFEPWVERVRQGEPNVLTREPVTHLVPTSGSSGPRKLIPFTAGLQREFNAAIGPWLVDLHRQFPGLLAGPAYWSITPPLQAPEESSSIPIGFESDTAYLGGARRRLAEAVMAVPDKVQRARTVDEFRYQTLLHLLRCRDLRLISVWHPSFLTLLLDALPVHWARLLEQIETDYGPSSGSGVRRVEELRRAGPHQPARLWPELRVISCWGDGNAELAIAGLKTRFPNTSLQRKGLLATEAVVTIPFAGEHILAVTSHFFEFLDGNDQVLQAHELQKDEEYEPVVSTAAGLCRYRLGDRVRVTGFLQKAPALQFLGRAGDLSDRCGEKLSEAFVAGVIRDLTGRLPSVPRFALLAPEESPSGLRYTLYLEGQPRPSCEEHLDVLLRQSPHYSLCRDLGQLLPAALFLISTRGYETFSARECAKGKRLGDIKPATLSLETGWSNLFEGEYLNTPVAGLSRIPFVEQHSKL